MVLKFLWPLRIAYLHNVTYTGVNMREKKSGALSRVQKIKKRLSHSFGRLAISKDEPEDARNRVTKLPFNGYSDEFLDRLEPNGNIPADKDLRYGESLVLVFLVGWGNCNTSVGFLLQRSIVTV
ncbi:uncharacterized protein LOC124353734 isoform X3 [Homalodisca vitripennis]|uniref:uncharacterized protein LOC124353734 isoform X3 n=1 Tax=Homalodisca vitripennis TaxID=197043 RepID=UPI001EEC7476|nr:uncharacterized protein LOC124353734 isoform X3 [Homalodisca vitripennis]